MFNSAKREQDPTYLFDLERYYKIWFSTKPDQFLAMEDQLRFIRMREENPQQVLHFIYSKICLSAKALEHLNKFCAQFGIIPIVFEDLESTLIHAQDKALYKIAQQELANCINGKEGNMASASDCVRLLVPVIEQHGIYSDFDVRLCLSTLNTRYVSLRGPLLLPAETIMLDQQDALLSPNSDFFACSLNEKDPKHLSTEALAAIRRVQGVILEKYQTPFCVEKMLGVPIASVMQKVPELSKQVAEFYRLYPNNPSVYDFRSYVKKLSGTDAEMSLMRLSVINMSGPGIYLFLFSHLFPQGVKNPPPFMPYKDKKWRPFLELYERCGTGFYEPIYDAIHSENSAIKAMSLDSKKDLAEFSWTREGMARKQKREQQTIYSALKIQGFWRRTLEEPCYKLYKEFKSISSVPALLEPIMQNKLALALRRACLGLKIDAIQLLVKHHQKYPFNINETSSTNPNTALDWVIKAKPANDVEKEKQQEIISILKQMGAQIGRELVAASPAQSSVKIGL